MKSNKWLFHTSSTCIKYRYPKGHIDDAKHMPYINKLKNGKYPKSPRTVAEVFQAFETNGNGTDFRRFYVGTHMDDDYGFAFSVFCSSKMIRRIEENITDQRDILMDATFRAVPVGPYKQLLIIYVAYDTTVIPITSILFLVLRIFFFFLDFSIHLRTNEFEKTCVIRSSVPIH